MPDFTLEDAARAEHGGLVAGVDEAGRGPLAGPVVAAAVILDKTFQFSALDDSKRLAENVREALFEEICAKAVVSVGIVDVAVIDKINILHASLLAMRKAFLDLHTPAQCALIDGDRAPELPCPARECIGGDSQSVSVAAASIVAKVTRDRLMSALHGDFPDYGWSRNKGYATPEHTAALMRHGVTAHHRRSFAPVAKALQKARVSTGGPR